MTKLPTKRLATLGLLLTVGVLLAPPVNAESWFNKWDWTEKSIAVFGTGTLYIGDTDIYGDLSAIDFTANGGGSNGCVGNTQYASGEWTYSWMGIEGIGTGAGSTAVFSLGPLAFIGTYSPWVDRPQGWEPNTGTEVMNGGLNFEGTVDPGVALPIVAQLAQRDSDLQQLWQDIEAAIISLGVTGTELRFVYDSEGSVNYSYLMNSGSCNEVEELRKLILP